MSVFDPSRCGTDSVEPISAIDLVPDCTVPAGPETLRQCPEPIGRIRALPGDAGDDGDAGPDGPAGDPGPKGDDGRDGCNLTLLDPQVTVTTTGPATTPSMSLTMAGSCVVQPIFSFTIPRGEDCDTICNIYWWCGDWIPVQENDADVHEPVYDGSFDGEIAIRCPCRVSSSVLDCITTTCGTLPRTMTVVIGETANTTNCDCLEGVAFEIDYDPDLGYWTGLASAPCNGGAQMEARIHCDTLSGSYLLGIYCASGLGGMQLIHSSEVLVCDGDEDFKPCCCLLTPPAGYESSAVISRIDRILGVSTAGTDCSCGTTTEIWDTWVLADGCCEEPTVCCCTDCDDYPENLLIDIDITPGLFGACPVGGNTTLTQYLNDDTHCEWRGSLETECTNTTKVLWISISKGLLAFADTVPCDSWFLSMHCTNGSDPPADVFSWSYGSHSLTVDDGETLDCCEWSLTMHETNGGGLSISCCAVTLPVPSICTPSRVDVILQAIGCT